MKLTDIIFKVGHYYRVAENFIRHPVDILAQRGRREAQHRLEEIEFPIGRDTSRSTPPHPVDSAEQKEQWRDRLKRDVSGSPVRTATAVPPLPPTVSHPPPNPLPVRKSRSVAIPLLSEQDQIRGRWGRYRRVGDVLQVGERVRCYNGLLALNNKPVLIKEYLLLERDFNAKEIRDRKEKFTALTNLNLRNGSGQDFRVVNLYEAIASPNSTENRCYLISEPIPQSQTLRQYLAAIPTGFTPRQVRHILAQVLQTLWFLHQQKVRLPTGEIQYGLPHGNLSLDSLLIVPKPLTEQPTQEDELQFFIYVTDLAVWEHLFLPMSVKVATPTLAQDLVDLGHLGFDLLTGNLSEQAVRPNLLLEHPWATVADLSLKHFIRQLVSGAFKANAEEARQVLLALPSHEASEQGESPTAEQATSSEMGHRFLQQLLLLGLLGGCVGGLLWMGGHWLVGRSPNATDRTRPCCLATIATLPDRPTTYVTEVGGIWDSVLRSPHSIALGHTLEQALQERDPRLSQYTLQTTQENGLAAVHSGAAAFALTEWQTNLPEGFEQQEVAYDGLVAVVAFSDGKPSASGEARLLKGIPKQLGGRITVEQLRQLYTGHAAPQNLAGSLAGWSIKLYRPADQNALQQFEQAVLRGDRTAIQQFRKRAIAPLPVNQMFSEILKDFEQRQTVGIGFARLSQVINQCSIYPLALGERGQEVQPLMQQGTAINSTTDLCGDKGSYTSDASVFSSNQRFLQHQYPLRYRLAVVYRQDSQAGRSFAEALKTDEGQYLLNAAGLVPIRNLGD